MTPRQAQVLDFIKAYHAEHGHPPSLREIGAGVGLKRDGTVHTHLVALRQLGAIDWTPGFVRTIVVREANR